MRPTKHEPPAMVAVAAVAKIVVVLWSVLCPALGTLGAIRSLVNANDARAEVQSLGVAGAMEPTIAGLQVAAAFMAYVQSFVLWLTVAAPLMTVWLLCKSQKQHHG